MNTTTSLKRIRELLVVRRDLHLYDKVILNLNSLVSTMFYKDTEYELNNSKPEVSTLYFSTIQSEIITFLESVAKVNKPLIVLYSDTDKFYHTKYFEKWHLQQQTRKELKTVYEVFESIIKAFENISRDMPYISIINTFEIEPYLITHTQIGKVLVISRDVLDSLVISYNDNIHRYSVYNGMTLLSKTDELENLYGVPIDAIPYYLAIAGVPKRNYSGIRGIGPVKAVAHINTNLDLILNGIDSLMNKATNTLGDVDVFRPRDYWNKFNDSFKERIFNQLSCKND